MNDYLVHDSSAELIAAADTVVTGVVARWRDDDLHPDLPSTDDPRFSPQLGMTRRQVDAIPPMPTTVFTVAVDGVLKARFPVGEEIEGRTSSVLNPAQGIYSVDADGRLSPVTSHNSLRPGSLSEVAEKIATQEAEQA